jgi:transcriptional regulator with XRE-family HTH domain
METSMTKYQHPIDAHVGKRLRLRRTLMGWTQEKLAEAIGLTFQQIQKYEKGANRISCSRLYDFSRLLDVPTSYFFDDLPVEFSSESLPASRFETDTVDAALMSTGDRPRRDTLELVRAFEHVSNKQLRHNVLKLVQSMGGSAAATSRDDRDADKTSKAI